jgi:hypothetical protein
MSDSRTRVDEAIDRAVRDLMRREPPAGFRARVLSRLEAPVRRIAFWPSLAAAAGMLVIAAIGINLLREAHVDEPPEAAPAEASQSAPPPPPLLPEAPPHGQIGAPAVGPAARRTPRAEPIRTATFPSPDGRVSATSLPPTHSEPAEATPPLVLEQTELSLPSPSAIEVRPLASPPPIEIAPIIVPPLRIPRTPQAPASPPR